MRLKESSSVNNVKHLQGSQSLHEQQLTMLKKKHAEAVTELSEQLDAVHRQKAK